MKQLLLLLTVIVGLSQTAVAGDYRYVSADELKGWLDSARPVLLVDIQEPNDFAAHHIKGSLETNSYPVKSEEEQNRLLPVLEKSKETEYEAVVVVCPRGKGGAERAYDFLAEHGIPDTKLYILSGGMAEWPHQEWVTAK